MYRIEINYVLVGWMSNFHSNQQGIFGLGVLPLLDLFLGLTLCEDFCGQIHFER